MSAKTSINALADTLGFTAKNFGHYVTKYQFNGTTNRQIRVNWTANGGVYTAELTRNTSTQPDEVIEFTDSAKKTGVEKMLRDVHTTPLAPKKTTAETTAKPTAAAPEPTDLYGTVAHFMRVAGQLDNPGTRDDDDDYHARLEEEFRELSSGMLLRDEVEIDDALSDIIVTALGWLYKRHGVPVGQAIITEVNRSNLTKVTPEDRIVYYPGSNKVAKPPHFSPADLPRAVTEAGGSYHTEVDA